MNKVLNEYIVSYLRDKYGDNLHAIIAYGSRVAGYASESSDYDYIVIVRDFKDKIRYFYEKFMNDVYASLLVVDKIFFEEDVLEGKHGEFVSGRLYNVFNPILNQGYIEKMEVILKSRAILEELCILKSLYGELINYLIIPLKYILFARLKKRMTAYPPVKYSYYKTYYGPMGSDNLNKSLDGFRKAAEALDREGLIEFSDDCIRIIQDGKFTCDFKEIMKILSRGFKMYITHGRSARVDLKVVVDEAASKVRRSLEGIRIPLELREPETLLNLRRGVLISTKKSLDEVIRSFEGSEARIISKKRKHLFSELYFVDILRGNQRSRLVLKKYSYFFFIKWIFIFLWLLGLKRL
jgi:predicted nucleotidyltransferase